MTTRQRRGLSALISAPTRSEAARSSGIAASTMRRWLAEDAEFKAAYDAAQAELISEAAAQAAHSLTRALTVLSEIMLHGSEQAKIQAARSVIDYSLKLRDAAETNERIKRIELALEELSDEQD